MEFPMTLYPVDERREPTNRSQNRSQKRCDSPGIEGWPGISPVSNPDLRTRIVRELYLAHHARIVAFLKRMTSADRAEDFAQEVFFRLFQVKNLETREITVSYLFRIGENLVRKAYHKDVRRRRADHELRFRSTTANATGSGRGIEADSGRVTELAKVSREALQGALDRLTEREEAAVRLIVCRGLSYEEAASALGVNVTTINNWKHRGVKKLRTFLSQQASADPGHRAAESGDPRRGDGGEIADQGADRSGRRSDRPSDSGVRFGRSNRLLRRA